MKSLLLGCFNSVQWELSTVEECYVVLAMNE